MDRNTVTALTAMLAECDRLIEDNVAFSEGLKASLAAGGDSTDLAITLAHRSAVDALKIGMRLRNVMSVMIEAIADPG
jgi:hypothetical protein